MTKTKQKKKRNSIVIKKVPQKKSKKTGLILLALVILGGLLFFALSSQKGETPVSTQREEAGRQDVQETGTPQAANPCDNPDAARNEIQSLAEAISVAENELQGLEVDLEFAQEDGSFVADIEESVEKQKAYITALTQAMSELQETIRDC